MKTILAALDLMKIENISCCSDEVRFCNGGGAPQLTPGLCRGLFPIASMGNDHLYP